MPDAEDVEHAPRAIAAIGAGKGKPMPGWKSALETLAVGGCAAFLAYAVGLAARGTLA